MAGDGTTWVLVGELAASAWMAAVIWLVQLLVYPGFHDAPHDDAGWRTFHARHTRRITPVVGPPIVVQGVLVVWLVVEIPDGVPAWLAVLGLGLVVASAGVTAFVARSFHRPLASGWDAGSADRLIRWNGVRTATWSAAFVAAVAEVVLHR